MSKVVIDASVAIKWVVEEDGTAAALALLQRGNLVAPDLLVAECANILWKKVRRKELRRDEALMAAQLLQGADIEMYPTRQLLDAATSMALQLDHPAYDCIYLALALANDWHLVTADERLWRKLRRRTRPAGLKDVVVPLADAAKTLARERKI